MLAVSYGGGTNSTAMLVGMKERGITPDVITFADTGDYWGQGKLGEKPETYHHIDLMQDWCKATGFPEITIVRKGGNGETLEEECLRRGALPSIAYGWKTCSQKFKLQPQEKFFNSYSPAKGVWAQGKKIIRAIGFDADEPQRAKEFDDPKYENWYPLIEWDWGRDECLEAIDREGIPRPGKSACWFCPSSSTTEIRWLAAKHPDLMDRALAMEANADLHTVKGLGRNFRWADVIATDDMFQENFIELSCGCYDG